MKGYFAYIRVSTLQQGEHGSSLQEQRDAIDAFSKRQGLNITTWFEERETAAKIGRRQFTRMLALLRKGGVTGVIFHKIDRSTRNLKDWSTIQDLTELGVDVRFAQESINLSSNEGKLTGDFLAVIAAHYIRNLREEVRKGFYGRLKQGFYPLPAPLGYLDQGAAKAKITDPVTTPHIRAAFELYATGGHSLQRLSDELYRRGLRSRNGKRVGVNRLAEILRNPFYIGVIRIKRTGESYLGVHEPIVSKGLFDRVQAALDGKTVARVITHDFLFRRMVVCRQCQYRLTGERRKGHVYYRCHTSQCPTISLREEMIESGIQVQFERAALPDDAVGEMRIMALKLRDNWKNERDERLQALSLQVENVGSRLGRLLDAFLDGALDRPLYDAKKLSLLMERAAFEEERARIEAGGPGPADRLLEFLELAKSLSLSYETANVTKKRDLVKTVTSNLIAEPKNVVVELRSPFREVAELSSVRCGGPFRDRLRTDSSGLFRLLLAFFESCAFRGKATGHRSIHGGAGIHSIWVPIRWMLEPAAKI